MKKINSDFINGIISLIFSQILIKIFGVLYSLYITNKTGFGDEGNAIYMSGYQIYALLLTVSSIGVPNAISKIISEKNSINDIINKERIFKISVFIFAVIGFIGCLLLFLFSEYISENILEIPETKLSLMVLSPAVFFVSITSVLRGYCNGENKIHITAKSQFFEQLIKSILTIILVEIVSKSSNNDTVVMAAMANFATTVSTFVSLIYITKKYLQIMNRDIKLNKYNFPKERILNVMQKVLKIAIPMTVYSILTSLGKNVDSITIVRILKNIIGEDAAKIKYGILSSKVDILVALPLAFNSSIAIALIPEISKGKVINDIQEIAQKIGLSITITISIAIPCMFGLFFYAEQIFDLLYPNANDGYTLLKFSAIGLVFSMFSQTINAILQGLGKNNIPVYAAFVGLIFKIIFNIVLIPIEGIYEKGAIIANIISNLISFIIVYFELKKSIQLKLDLFKKISVILINCFIMIFSSLKIYNFLLIKNINKNVSTVISIVIAVIIYGFFIFVMNLLNKNNNPQTLENTEKK